MKQRQLTQGEIDLAPDGFKHYTFMANGSLTYLDRDNSKMMTIGMVERGENSISAGSYFSESEIQPIPRKAFDVTRYEFGDSDWSINEIDINDGFIDFYNHETCTDDGDSESHVITKDDAIAIAKALGVTAEDFK